MKLKLWDFFGYGLVALVYTAIGLLIAVTMALLFDMTGWAPHFMSDIKTNIRFLIRAAFVLLPIIYAAFLWNEIRFLRALRRIYG